MATAASHTARTIATSTAMYLMYVTAVFATSSSFQQPAAINEITVPSADFSPADFVVYHSSHLQDVTPLAFSPALHHTHPHTHTHLHNNFHQDWGPDVMEDDMVTKQQCPWQQMMKTNTDPEIFHKASHPITKVNSNSHYGNQHQLDCSMQTLTRDKEMNKTVGKWLGGRCLPLDNHLFTHPDWTVVPPGTAVC